MSIFRKLKFHHFYILLVVAIFLLRSILFASNLGGIEHDSGWFLGVARNLAQRGIYASYTNTAIEGGVGVSPSIHGRFSVQDENGFTYFPAGVTVGPGYIIPQALLMKIFGYDFWQFRLWSLITYAGLIFFIFLIVYELGDWLALVLTQVWLWFVPHLMIQFSYESYGEHTALFYLLVSFYVLFLGLKKKRKKILPFLISGLFISFSILTKYLYFMTGVGFFVLFLVSIYSAKEKKKTLFYWLCWLIAAVVPIVLFEAYRYLFLVNNFGIDAWKATTEDFLIHFKSNGGGINLSNIDWEFLARKLTLWDEVGLRSSIVWLTIFPLIFLVFKKISSQKRSLLILVFLAFLTNTAWFILISNFGWTRHVWPGLVIGMMLFAIGVSYFYYEESVRPHFLKALMIILFVLSIIQISKFTPSFLLNQKKLDQWQTTRNERGIQGLPSNPILSLEDQKELQEYFSKNINKNDRVYYLGWLLVAEASPIVDKAFFSIDRYIESGQVNPEGGKSYLIMGPYQKGKFSIVGSTYHDKKVGQLCASVVFENPSYTLCVLRDNLVYKNEAYE